MCAASEIPIKLPEDMIYFGDRVEDILKELERQNFVKNTPNGWVYSGIVRATEAVNLDNISSNTFKIICNGTLLETKNRAQAYREAHKGAILLHKGETYIVEDLDLKNSIAQVIKKDVDYYTEAIKAVDITIIKKLKRKKSVVFLFHLVRLK